MLHAVIAHFVPLQKGSHPALRISVPEHRSLTSIDVDEFGGTKSTLRSGYGMGREKRHTLALLNVPDATVAVPHTYFATPEPTRKSNGLQDHEPQRCINIRNALRQDIIAFKLPIWKSPIRKPEYV